MLYQTYTPAPLLQPFICMYYILEHDGEHDGSLDISIPPNSTACLVFNSREAPLRSGKQHQYHALPKHFLTGPSTKSSLLRLNRQHFIVGIVLNGSGKLRLFDVLPSNIEDRRFSLDLFLGSQTDCLSQKIQEAKSNEEIIAVLDAFFLFKLRHHIDQFDWLDRAEEMILERKGLIRMDTLASMLNVSARHLRRQFTERTGIGPKHYARLKRFNYAHALLSRYPDIGWQELTHRTGYYDQAHMIKDFSQFLDARPTAVLKWYEARSEPSQAV